MKLSIKFLLLFLIINFVQEVRAQQNTAPSERPNIIILFADDMGYGDLSSFGHPTIRTPNLDTLAAQGIRLTSYEAAPWCVPSRVELLTGQYIPRVNLNGHTGADGSGGLPDEVLTLAEGLKKAGYATGMAGKWHLGYKQNKFLPTNQGFDSWLGLPYSNDYMPPFVQTDEPLVMYRDTSVTEYPVNQDSLTVKYTAEAGRFIEENAGNTPFFFYLAYNMPHLPIHTTAEFEGTSNAGLYGDVVQTIDWSAGEIMKMLEKRGLAKNTIIFFASDNGPWLNPPDRMKQAGNKPWHQGTTGPLRGAKATTFEGGTRVPAMIRWPAHIPAGQVSDALIANPDVYRTMLTVGGATIPDSLDGYNMMPFFTGATDQLPREEYAYFLYGTLEALRVGHWKLKLTDKSTELYNLQDDVAERYNRAQGHPKIVERFRKRMNELVKEYNVRLPTSKK